MSINPSPAAFARPLKIIIVDDSAVVRGMVARWLEPEPDMVLAGLATDGEKGIEKVREVQPDLLILDVEMPNMGGLEALPKMLAAKPGLKILMASNLTTRGADVTLRALELGAADYIPKPDSSRLGGAESFRSEMLAKIRALCGRRQMPPTAAHGHVPLTPFTAVPRPVVVPITPNLRPRSLGPKRIDVLVVGASTGGPPALRNFLLGLGPDWKLPVLIVQHMPATFTAILAEHLDKVLPQKVQEAKDGMAIESRNVYIAPGDFHMTVVDDPICKHIRLDQSPQVNWCRPAVDPLFRSAAEVYGHHALGVVLTGMGHDGRDGAQALVDAGASVMAQDEASSVVWGMPGAVAEAGLAEIIKPIDGLSQACKTFARGERP